jgi:cob(I)alamin adenosyltransferase
MAIWGRLRQELDRASRAAQGAVDEGRARLELFRARQRADRAAQALGYAAYRARKEGRELSTDQYEQHAVEITRAEGEIERLERQLSDLRRQTPADTGPTAHPPATT